MLFPYLSWRVYAKEMQFMTPELKESTQLQDEGPKEA